MSETKKQKRVSKALKEGLERIRQRSLADDRLVVGLHNLLVEHIKARAVAAVTLYKLPKRS